jgi:ribonuclease P protein component
VVQEAHREAHVPTQQPPARQAPRVPSPHVDPGGPGRPSVAPPQGSPQAVGLIWRIRDRRTFLELRRSGRRAGAGKLSLSFLPDPVGRGDPPRVAFAIPTRVGPAVVRNRIRRRIRSVLRTLVVTAPSSVPQGAYLFSVRPGAQTRTYEELSNDVQQALSKVQRSSRPPSAGPS